MKKPGLKIFSKLAAFVLAISSASNFSVSACKQPFPTGSFRVFNVAVIGSDIVDGRPTGEENKRAIDYLCSVGARLENFIGVETFGTNTVTIGSKILPRTSVLVEQNIFCFYDVVGPYSPGITSDVILQECPYAICPYRLDLAETPDKWQERMKRLRDFVKGKNEMCDLKFLGIIDGGRTEEISTYMGDVSPIAYRNLDIYKYQQTVNADYIFTGTFLEDCRRIVLLCTKWDREEEFMCLMHKGFPEIISSTGKALVFTQRGTEKSDFSMEASAIYEECFITSSEGGSPIGYEVFSPFLNILKKHRYHIDEMIEGFRNVGMVGMHRSCLQIVVCKDKEFNRGGDAPDAPYDISNIYDTVFKKNKDVRKSFEIIFEELLEKRYAPESIKQTLCSFKDKNPFHNNFSDSFSFTSNSIDRDGKGKMSCIIM